MDRKCFMWYFVIIIFISTLPKGKVLQESQEEGEQLKHQVEQLQETLKKAGIEEPTMTSCQSDINLSYKSGVSTSYNSSLCIPPGSIEYTSTLTSDLYSSSLPNKQLQFCSPSLCHLPEIQTKVIIVNKHSLSFLYWAIIVVSDIYPVIE